jgi:pimeloyl-ACP methyl ester carboxylesterase
MGALIFDQRSRIPRGTKRSLTRSILATAAALAASAVYVHWRARVAERENPPAGKFMVLDGMRLHYSDRGSSAPAVVLFHGNGSMAREMEISGLVGALATDHRVITFDRPGFGYSERPRSIAWTPAAQAELMHTALQRLGVNEAIVLGHSWGTLVALELALRQPQFVRGLLLVSGYYFPVPRKELTVLSVPAIPLFGDILRHTIVPLIARAIAPTVIRRLFAPRPVDDRFAEHFPVDLAVRPLHIRAAAEELAMLLAAAASLEPRYGEIRQPTILISGSADRIVDVEAHSTRLREAIPQSELYVLPNDGHMVHHHAPLTILQAIERLVELSSSPKRVGARS